MAAPRFRFLASLTAESGALLGRYPISPDWHPLAECADFNAMRQSNCVRNSAVINPVWDEERGAPFVCGSRASVTDAEGREVSCDAPITYFRSQVQNIAALLVNEGTLKEGDTYHYRIAAFPCGPPETRENAISDWGIEDVTDSPVFGERSLAAYLHSSREVGEIDAKDFPVFIPSSVLMQAEALKQEAREKETGGVLIGYLWRDTDSAALFAEITALIPAQHTVASAKRLTFTPQTWDAVQAAICLRNRGEAWIAWHHTHPSRYWCECEPEAQRSCPLGRQFFSVDDVTVHRTVFARGFNTALVTGDRPLAEGGWEMVHVLYGWRNGMVEPRGFNMLDLNELSNYLPAIAEK